MIRYLSWRFVSYSPHRGIRRFR